MSQEVTQISVTNLPVETKEVLEQEAKKQDRSMASLVRTVLIEYAAKLASKAVQAA